MSLISSLVSCLSLQFMMLLIWMENVYKSFVLWLLFVRTALLPPAVMGVSTPFHFIVFIFQGITGKFKYSYVNGK